MTTLEKIVIREAKHNYTCLQLFGYHVDAVMVNRIYPQQVLAGYFHKWRELQEKSLELLSRELKGVETLTRTAARLYGEKDPLEVLQPLDFMMLQRREDGDIL